MVVCFNGHSNNKLGFAVALPVLEMASAQATTAA